MDAHGHVEEAVPDRAAPENDEEKEMDVNEDDGETNDAMYSYPCMDSTWCVPTRLFIWLVSSENVLRGTASLRYTKVEERGKSLFQGTRRSVPIRPELERLRDRQKDLYYVACL